MSTESNFSFTTKIDGADLLTVRGDTYDEFLANAITLANVPGVLRLVNVLSGEVAAAPAAPVNAAIAAVATGLGGSVVGDPFGGSFEPVAPPAAVAGPGDRTCSHGVMVKRTGESEKGPWRAFFCPTPKGTPDQCKAIFVKRGTPEWAAF